MKYTYSIESFYHEEWHKLFTETRDFCLGYFTNAQYSLPRNGLRIMRSDGKVMKESLPHEDVGIGQVAGFPTPQQYEAAARRALEQAQRIREHEAKYEARRNGKSS